MDETTRLLLIRHAHVDTGPPPGRLCGWLDLPLSPKGRTDLLDLLSRSRSDGIPDALYTSTLTRAREVAAALSRRWNRAVQPETRLREIACGRLEGVPMDDAARAYPELWARNRAQDDDDFAWPDGESYRAFRARVLEGLRRIAAAHRGGRAAVVTHAGVIAQVIGVIEGRRAAQWEPCRPDFLTATEIVWSGREPVDLVAFNERNWW